MGGRMSRNKGKRAEYLVRDYLRSIGFTDAVRVPLSGASEGFKGDVVFTNKQGKKFTVEVKSRASAFKTIYEHYVNKIVLHPSLGTIVVYNTQDDPNGIFTDEVDVRNQRDFKQFETLNDLRQGADILAIKDNNKPILFIEFEDL